ncbi:MAG: hypothetical protein HYU36_13845 [Planctomycetes bacterium]|nr:hypothetical protein [Planctomycetota bacterium]
MARSRHGFATRLERQHEPYFQGTDDLVRALNQQLGKETLFVAPVGQP